MCSAICRRTGAQEMSGPTPSGSCSRRASIAHLRVGGGKSRYGFARPQSWGCALVGTGSRRQYPGPVTPRTPDRGRGGRRPLDGTIIVVPYRSRATHNRGRAECTNRGSGLQTRFEGILSTGPCSGRQCGHFEVAYVIFGRKNGFLANFRPSRPKIQPVPKVVLRPSARTLEVVGHDRVWLVLSGA